MGKDTFFTINKIFIITSIFLLTSTGCKYDKQDLILAAKCDTTLVTFSGSVKPILTAYCVSCHSGPGAFNGVELVEYFSVKMQVTNGKLLNTITHTPGFSPMPLGALKLSDCNIAKIRKWINEGSPNN